MHLARQATIVFSLLLPMLSLFSAAQTSPLIYPQPKRGDQVDDYHGVKVADPYRWLEDTDSPETHDWVEAENKLTFGYLEQIPYRQAIRDRLIKLWNFERYTVPDKEGGRYFFQHNNGLQNQNVLLVAESLNAEPPYRTMASSSPTASRSPAPTGPSGMCATSTPERISPTISSG
jgi:prolyl oligopeptidase